MAKKLVKAVVGIVIIGGAIGYMVWNAIQSSWAYDIGVDEFVAQEKDTQTYSSRVGGVVEAGSVSRILEKLELNFKLQGKEKSLTVSFHGTVPENFEEGREVLVEGRLDTHGVFQADKLITKCESKYQAKARGEEDDQEKGPDEG